MEDQISPQKESVKLTRNAKGNYQWEIKLLSDDKISDLEINRLEELDQRLKNKFPDIQEIKSEEKKK